MDISIGSQIDVGAGVGTVHVRGALGEGRFGRVYLVQTDAGDSLALKWFKPEAAVHEQWETIVNLIRYECPDARLLWPIALIGRAADDQFGYLMPVRGDRYLSMTRLSTRRGADGQPLQLTSTVIIELCRQLTEVFQRLHAQGMSYRDISLGNLFFDPTNGDVLVCDVDNVDIDNGTSRVLGTGRFMAPEVVRRESLPGKNTDRYSLAVLLFLALFCDHPLEGEATDTGLRDEDFVLRHFGTNPVFSMHPTDHSNRPVSASVPIYWNKIYPRRLLALFEQTFTEGLTDPTRRIPEAQWVRAFTRLRDLMGVCPGCARTVFYDPASPERVCWSCSTPLGSPLILTHGKRQVVVGPELILADGASVPAVLQDGAPGVIAHAVAHPRDARRIGLSNRTTGAWKALFADGEEQDVAPGQAVELLDGITITGTNGLHLRISREPLPETV